MTQDMKITILFTGGTIGSSVGSDGYISPNAECPYRLLDLYQRKYNPKGLTFETKEPYRILSENLQAENVNTLIGAIYEALDEKTDGVIVTHGTDTLQYTTALMGYAFGQTEVPIVFVSSDFPLEDERANGLCNFAHAVDFIRGGFGQGVFASYKNPGGIPQIHVGTRMLAHNAYSADMLSVEGKVYGSFVTGADGVETFVKHDQSMENRKKCGNICELVEKPEEFLEECGKQILRIIPYPGMEYPGLSSEHKVILHESYHSGTIAISKQLEAFAKEAKERNILFYITGVPYQEKEYETVREYERMGIKILPRMSPLAAYCKLWLAVSMGMDIEEVMHTEISGDIIEGEDETIGKGMSGK